MTSISIRLAAGLAVLLALCMVTPACTTTPFDFGKAEQYISNAIAAGDYKTADRLITEEETEAPGGLNHDARLLRWATVKAKLGQYAEASRLIDQLLLEYPNSPSRSAAMSVREWVQAEQEILRRKGLDPRAAPVP